MKYCNLHKRMHFFHKRTCFVFLPAWMVSLYIIYIFATFEKPSNESREWWDWSITWFLENKTLDFHQKETFLGYPCGMVTWLKTYNCTTRQELSPRHYTFDALRNLLRDESLGCLHRKKCTRVPLRFKWHVRVCVWFTNCPRDHCTFEMTGPWQVCDFSAIPFSSMLGKS
jgi:hypothetical protein